MPSEDGDLPPPDKTTLGSRPSRTLVYVNQIMTELAVTAGFVAIAWMAVNGVTDPNVGPYGAIIALGGGKLAKDYFGGRPAPSPSRPAKDADREAHP